MSQSADFSDDIAFDSPQQEALLNILRTADQFQNAMIRLLREYSVTPSQFNVLRILEREGRPLPSLEIAHRLIQVVPAITGLIDRLEKANFVERNRCDLDRRVVYVSLTDTGMALLDQLTEPTQRLHRELLGHLPENDLRQLSRLLVTARRATSDESVEVQEKRRYSAPTVEADRSSPRSR